MTMGQRDDSKMIIDLCDDGKLTLTGDLKLLSVDDGRRFLPILEFGDIYQAEYLGDLLRKYLEPNEPSYRVALFGKVRITIEKA